MPEFCTCGAQLPPDARFCHKCGKPQQEEPASEAAPPDTNPLSPVPGRTSSAAALEKDAPLALNFRNPVAVRVGLTLASVATLLSSLPWLSYGGFIWLFSAGFFSVYLYRRRTGQPLTVRSGARMGWITGVLSFVIITILFTISIVAMRTGDLAGLYRERMPVQDRNMEQALQLLQSPGGLASILLLSLLVMFVLITSICTAGGALGAKIAGKD